MSSILSRMGFRRKTLGAVVGGISSALVLLSDQRIVPLRETYRVLRGAPSNFAKIARALPAG